MRRNTPGLNFIIIFLAASLVAGAAQAADPAAVARGKDSFQEQCAMCHAAKPVEGGDQGPNLAGVVGRMAASVPGFAYTPALKASKKIWTVKNLDTFLADPPSFIPGTRMPVNVGEASDRADIIAFLSSTN